MFTLSIFWPIERKTSLFYMTSRSDVDGGRTSGVPAE